MYVRLLFFPLCWSSFPTAAQTSFVSVFCAVALRNLNCFVVLLPPTPPSLRFSYSPVTLISMCPEQYEWVSSPAEAAPRLQCNAFKRRLIPSRLFPFTCIPPVTHFLTPTNLLLHCMLSGCLPSCLAEHETRKSLLLSPSPPYHLDAHLSQAVRNHPAAP